MLFQFLDAALPEEDIISEVVSENLLPIVLVIAVVIAAALLVRYQMRKKRSDVDISTTGTDKENIGNEKKGGSEHE